MSAENINKKSNRNVNFKPRALPEDVVYCQCGCNERIPYINIYKYTGYPKYIKTHTNNIRKGKTNKELFGEEKAKQMSIKPKGFGKKISSILKGKSWEEKCGKERAAEIIQKNREYASQPWDQKFNSSNLKQMRQSASERMSIFNKDREWTKEEVIEKINEIQKERKLMRQDISSFGPENGLPPWCTIVRLFGSLENFNNEMNIDYDKFSRAQYNIEHPEVNEKNLANNIIFKTISLQEKYGEEKAEQMKKQMSEERIKGFKNGTLISWNKGKTKFDHPSIMAGEEERQKTIQKKIQENPMEYIQSSYEKMILEWLDAIGIKYIPQHHIPGISLDEHDLYHWPVDIYLPDYNLMIEVDGEHWHDMNNRREIDKKRTELMISLGYRVQRFDGIQFTNKERFGEVLDTIKKLIEEY